MAERQLSALQADDDVRRFDVDSLVFGLHDMDVSHVLRWIAQDPETWPPVHIDRHGFVHDGRHRVIASFLLRRTTVRGIAVGR